MCIFDVIVKKPVSLTYKSTLKCAHWMHNCCVSSLYSKVLKTMHLLKKP